MIVEIFEEVKGGIRISGLCHMDGRKKETKEHLKKLNDLRKKYNIKKTFK